MRSTHRRSRKQRSPSSTPPCRPAGSSLASEEAVRQEAATRLCHRPRAAMCRELWTVLRCVCVCVMRLCFAGLAEPHELVLLHCFERAASMHRGDTVTGGPTGHKCPRSATSTARKPRYHRQNSGDTLRQWEEGRARIDSEFPVSMCENLPVEASTDVSC